MARSSDGDSPRRSASARRGGGRRFLRVLMWVGVVAAVGGAAAFGLKSLEAHVVGSDENGGAPTSVRVRVSPIPPWMPYSVATDVASNIISGDAEFNDPALVQIAYDRLMANPWVRSVEQVRKQHTADPLVGILEVRATFREPLAALLLKDGKTFAFVDEDLVRLRDEANRPGPARWMITLSATAERPAPRDVYYWDRGEVPQGFAPRPVFYFVIEGVEEDPPSPGQKWQGADLADAIRLVKLLRGRPYATQIASLDVRNYGGRAMGSSGKPHILIRARGRNGEPVEVGFGRFPMPHGDYILSAERRLANLDDYIARCGGFFGVHRRIDLQYDRIHAE